jgi:hypothetical protein
MFRAWLATGQHHPLTTLEAEVDLRTTHAIVTLDTDGHSPRDALWGRGRPCGTGCGMEQLGAYVEQKIHTPDSRAGRSRTGRSRNLET